MSENNFIAHIVSPTLESPNFASQLDAAFRTIEENFKKIVSAPYLEGQEGVSILAVDMPIIDENNNLTLFGAGLVQTIFGDERIYTIEEIDNDPRRQPIGGYKASDYLMDHPTVKVFCKYSPDSGRIENYICFAEYYCFLDMRVEGLGNLSYPSTQGTTFYDYTCQIFGGFDESLGSSGEWVFDKGIMLPTIYFNADQGYFCWKINNVMTGIRAQGIKGDQGRPPLAAVVKGTGTEFQSDGTTGVVVSVDKYLNMYSSGSSQDPEVSGGWDEIGESEIQDGDLVCCLFDCGDSQFPGISFQDMLIGNIRVNGDRTVFTITLPSDCRFSSLWRDYILFYAFRGINYKSCDMRTTKAVFIPAATYDTVGVGAVHAIFQDDTNVEYVENEQGVWTSEDETRKDNLVFKKVDIKRILGNNSVGNDKKMSSIDSSGSLTITTKARFIGYNVTGEVNGLQDVYLGTPVGTVVNWLNADRIPDGWYRTGEIDQDHTSEHKPVFALVETQDDTDFDIAVKTYLGDVIGYMNIHSVDQNGDVSVERDFRFANLFCQLMGVVPYDNNIDLYTDDTDSTTTTVMEYVSEYIEPLWDGYFDTDIMSINDGDDYDGIKLYLTKLIDE